MPRFKLDENQINELKKWQQEGLSYQKCTNKLLEVYSIKLNLSTVARYVKQEAREKDKQFSYNRYLKNKEEYHQQSRKYYKNNAEELRKDAREYAKEHKEERKKYNQSKAGKKSVKKYKRSEKNRISRVNYRHKRRQHMKESDIDSKWLKALFENTTYCSLCGCLLEKDKNKCYDQNYINLDHVVPLNIGGTHTKNNVRYICSKYNNSRPNDGSDI